MSFINKFCRLCLTEADTWLLACRAKQEKAAAAETKAMADITTNLDASERFGLPDNADDEAAGKARPNDHL